MMKVNQQSARHQQAFRVIYVTREKRSKNPEVEI